MITPLHRPPRDVVHACARVTDPAMPPLVRQEAWLFLKHSRGQDVDLSRIMAMQRAVPDRFERIR